MSIKAISLVKMSEKLCLQWNDFKENFNSAFGKLRGDKEFTDVTMVCEDGHNKTTVLLCKRLSGQCRDV